MHDTSGAIWKRGEWGGDAMVVPYLHRLGIDKLDVLVVTQVISESCKESHLPDALPGPTQGYAGPNTGAWPCCPRRRR